MRQTETALHDLDVAAFRAINNGPEGLSGLMVFMSDATQYWPVRIALVVLFIALIASPRLRHPALVAAASVVLTNALCDVIKHSLGFGRPSDEVLGAIVRVLGGHGYGAVSAHSANMMAVAVVFLAVDRWWGFGWLVIALLTGISRIYCGVHYPSQVLLGWSLGAAVGIALLWLSLALWKPGASRPGVSKDPHSPECPVAPPQSGSEPSEPL